MNTDTPQIDNGFERFDRIPRLSRECIVTEKIDGTNAQIYIRDGTEENPVPPGLNDFKTVTVIGGFEIWAGSRERWVTPGKKTDNYGFAQWVLDNAHELTKLGKGRHYGEWWGRGINRGYGLDERRFSLFNVSKWANNPDRPLCCHVVPELWRGNFDTLQIEQTLSFLRCYGSSAALGFMRPEGIIVFHTAKGNLFKKTIENDDKPKSAV